MSEPVFVAHPDGRFYKVQDPSQFKNDGFTEVGTHRTDVDMFYRNLSTAGTDEPEAPSLDSLTKEQLKAIAIERGVEHAADATKAEIIAAIEEAG